jgi:hypothetical protein
MAATKRIKINKTPGSDSITNRIIKAGGEPLARILHGLFQQLWTWGCTPRSWSRVLVNPIHKGKKKDKLDPSSYRGIALSSALAKTFEIIVDQRLEEDTRIRNICTSKQFGSKRGNSCSDAMHPFLSHIEQERQAGRPVHCAMIDFETAFPSVSRAQLYHQLRQNGIKGNILRIIKSLTKEHSVRVLHPDIDENE